MDVRTYEDISNLYTQYPGHPTYSSGILETDDVVDSIVQKIEMILFTSKGETADPNFGADVERMLWKSSVAADVIKGEIIDQISRYAPELIQSAYTVEVFIYQGTFRDIGIVEININGGLISALFS